MSFKALIYRHRDLQIGTTSPSLQLATAYYMTKEIKKIQKSRLHNCLRDKAYL